MGPIGLVGRVCLILLSACAAAGAADVTWDTVICLTTNPASQTTGYPGQHSVAADAAGNVHVVWLDQRNVPYQVWYRKYDVGSGTWLAETALTNRPANCFRPGIACDSAGNVHAAWHVENYLGPGIWYKRYSAATGSWKPDTLIDTTTTLQPQSYPSVSCVSGSGDVDVAWYGSPDTGMYAQVFLKERHPATGWDSATQVSTAAVIHDQVSVAAGRNGNVVVVWIGRDLGDNYNQVYCRRRIGSAWQDAELVSDIPLGLGQYSPCVAIDRKGAVHVVWHGRFGMNTYQQVFHRKRDSTGWSGIDSISGERNYQQQFPSVACDAVGRCHAVWSSPAGSDHAQLVYGQRDTDGIWSTPMILTGLDSGDVSHPSIACDSDSGIHVVWDDASSGNQDVYYLRGFTPGSGVADEDLMPQAPSSTPVATIIRGGLLSLESSVFGHHSGIALLDASGRKMTKLRPGPNDIRGLPGGVYFVVGKGSTARPAPVIIVK